MKFQILLYFSKKFYQIYGYITFVAKYSIILNQILSIWNLISHFTFSRTVLQNLCISSHPVICRNFQFTIDKLLVKRAAVCYSFGQRSQFGSKISSFLRRVSQSTVIVWWRVSQSTVIVWFVISNIVVLIKLAKLPRSGELIGFMLGFATRPSWGRAYNLWSHV